MAKKFSQLRAKMSPDAQIEVSAKAKKMLEALDTQQFFAERSKNADLELFERILTRNGGEPPREGDELPD